MATDPHEKLLEGLLDLLASKVSARLTTAPRWLSSRDAANYCGTSRRVLEDARRDGELTASKLGRGYVYGTPALDAWVTSRGVGAVITTPSADASTEALKRSVARSLKRTGKL